MKAHLLGTSLKAIGFVLLILSAGIENAAYGGPIPALIDFDNDVPGSPPAIGGVNEPTSLDVSANTSVLVQSASNGINTQPVVLDEGGTGDFVSVNYALSAPQSSSGFPSCQKVLGPGGSTMGSLLPPRPAPRRSSVAHGWSSITNTAAPRTFPFLRSSSARLADSSG